MMLNNIISRCHIKKRHKAKKSARENFAGRYVMFQQGCRLLVGLDGNGTVKRNVLLAFAKEVGVVGCNVEL